MLVGLWLFGLSFVVAIPATSNPFRFSVAAFAQPRDPVVTSDLPEYCSVLMNRITGITSTTAAPPPTAAAVLSEEGERMCVHGQIRGGILRLRRALEIIRQGED